MRSVLAAHGNFRVAPSLGQNCLCFVDRFTAIMYKGADSAYMDENCCLPMQANLGISKMGKLSWYMPGFSAASEKVIDFR